MRTRAILASVVTWSAMETAALGADQTIPVRLYTNRPATLTKVLAKGIFPLPEVTTANPVLEGGQLVFSEGATTDTIALPAAGWSALGNPPGSKGFKYRDITGATCLRVLIKANTIKALCRATTPGSPPYQAGVDDPLEITLSVGGVAPDNQRYIGECPDGGEQKGNPAHLTKLTNCSTPPVPTPTPDQSVCCEAGGFCGSAPSVFGCLELFGGVGVGGGAVCDATNNCVAPPGVAGDCCEGTNVVAVCSMNVDEASCVENGGTYVANATCSAQAVCVPAP